MLPVVELRARIVQVRSLTRGDNFAGNIGRTAKQCTRLAMVSVGYADGYPYASANKLQVLVGGYRCPVAGEPFMDLLPIDVSDLPDPTAARYGNMVTLIGGEIGIDDVASATGSTGKCSAISGTVSTASTMPFDRFERFTPTCQMRSMTCLESAKTSRPKTIEFLHQRSN